MATFSEDTSRPNARGYTITLGADDASIWFEGSVWGDKSVHIMGTPDGATVLVEGSNDRTNAVTLVDTLGNSVSYTALPKLPTLMQRPRWIRARTTGGTGSTAITIIIEAARSIR